MSGSQKGGAYARALARELPLEHGDLRAIASRLGLQIREVDADGFDGALIRAREIPLGTIAIRQSIREAGRKNFTLAHEIAHFLLPDHDLTELVCTRSDIGNWGDWSRELEREADESAAELLLPASAVQPIVESAPPSLQVIEKIAQRFHTSLSAAAWRYCDLSKQSCAIVWATNDRIDWSKRSRHFGFPLQGGAPSARHVCVAMLCGNTWSEQTAGAPRAFVDLRNRFSRRCPHMGGVQGAARLQQCNFAALDQILGSTKAVVEPGVGAGGQEVI